MNVLVVAGARPNFMKVAPVLAALERAGHGSVLVHTGQHYDDAMSQAFFDDLGIRAPDRFLGVGGGTHAVQTARIMERFEPVLLEARPDWVLVPGDVNSTLAAALVTVKLKEETGARLAHLEAGLRSYDWRMPEEVNRVLTDRCADLLLTPSRDAHALLAAEGIAPERVHFVGNVMIDTLYARLAAARALDMPARFGLEPGAFAVATLHRPSNVDTAAALRVCLEALGRVAERVPLVLPLHPRTRQKIDAFGLRALLDGIVAVEPMGYTELLSLTDAAAAVLTDSGGLQEETTVLGVPCVTLRERTERPVTVEQGTNRMAPWPLDVAGVVAAFERALAAGRAAQPCRIDGWDGRAAERVVAALEAVAGRDRAAPGPQPPPAATGGGSGMPGALDRPGPQPPAGATRGGAAAGSRARHRPRLH
jgi:UDP-N-acetylglucosamine 2-epimerase (non-hydrolysing)